MFRKILAKAYSFTFSTVRFGCIVYCVDQYLCTVAWCEGLSMQPTIHSGDVVLAENVTRLSQNFNTGDVVISRSPSNPREYICKRIKALEGNVVYNDDTGLWKSVPRGHVWLEGDNSYNSTDSRDYGPVPYALLRSKVVVRVWPIERVGPLSGLIGGPKDR